MGAATAECRNLLSLCGEREKSPALTWGRGYSAGMKRPGSRLLAVPAALTMAVTLLVGCGSGDEEAQTTEVEASVLGPRSLLDAQRITVLDQRVQYPTRKNPAEVSSEIRVLEPGQETGWRRNRVPTYVYILEGSVTMDYDNGVTRDFVAGDAYMEAQGVWHNGTNRSEEPVRILSVHLGRRGMENVAVRE
jgi:quercetin dioxygenase-like cupin family protein